MPFCILIKKIALFTILKTVKTILVSKVVMMENSSSKQNTDVQTAQMETAAKMESLAAEIVSLSHASLVLHLRFMESALLRLNPVPAAKGTISVNGASYNYVPKHVLARYKKDSGTAARRPGAGEENEHQTGKRTGQKRDGCVL